ncbi:MAG: hypothetical protein H8D67_12880 [Deltaproteobacteria bacterium]|nr:hypothetical protein [Deltaproteobacteria bacterium]
MKKMDAFEHEDIRDFEPEAKIGLIATINLQGQPHITLISSIRAKTITQLIWGQFTEGLSKSHVKTNPKTGFLILTMDKQLWRGKATWTMRKRTVRIMRCITTSPCSGIMPTSASIRFIIWIL